MRRDRRAVAAVMGGTAGATAAVVLLLGSVAPADPDPTKLSSTTTTEPCVTNNSARITTTEPCVTTNPDRSPTDP